MTMEKTPLPPGARTAVRPDRRADERGEGVISAAIAVLVMAFIGVGMWVAFKNNTPINPRS